MMLFTIVANLQILADAVLSVLIRVAQGFARPAQLEEDGISKRRHHAINKLLSMIK